MKIAKRPSPQVERMRTGIGGLDDALGGGLPRGRTTLVVGGTGAGKTIFTLQTLAEGARAGEAGVLLSFEEDPHDVLQNMAAFTWAIANLRALFAEESVPPGGVRAEIEIIDVQREPARAALDRILVTPSLLKLSPAARPETRRRLKPARRRARRQAPRELRRR